MDFQFTEGGHREVSPWSLQPEDLLLAVQPRHRASVDREDWEYPEHLTCWTTLAVFRLTGEIAPLGEHGTNGELVSTWP